MRLEIAHLVPAPERQCLLLAHHTMMEAPLMDGVRHCRRKRGDMMSHVFTRFSNGASRLAGHYLTFVVAVVLILVWALTGPLLGFSETWQLIVNTGTTIVTFMMVFLIQNTQNRDSEAVHIKLDEIIHSLQAADDRVLDAEDQSDEMLQELKKGYKPAGVHSDPPGAT